MTIILQNIIRGIKLRLFFLLINEFKYNVVILLQEKNNKSHQKKRKPKHTFYIHHTYATFVWW